MADNGTGVANFARSLLGQGLAMGWGDEAEAWIRSKLGDEAYDQAYQDIQNELGGYRERNPITAGGAELAGGLLPMAASYFVPGGQAAAPATTARGIGALARMAANPVLRGAVTGATTGAIAGAGAASPGQRGEGALVGGAIGTGVGAAAPVVMRGAGSGYNWLRDRLIPTEEAVTSGAAQRINRALSTARGGEGMTPAEAAQVMAEDRARGIPSTFANVDPATVGLAETVAQRSGASAQRVEKGLGEQSAGSRERVYSRTKSELGGGNFYEDEQRLVDELRQKAKDIYSDAYAVGSVNDPRINQVLKDPQFKGFYDRAREIADREALAAKLRGEDPSKYALEELYKFDNDGNIVSVNIPDVRTLDYIKRGIDATIERGYKGEGMSTAEANSLKELRKVFVNAIDEATVDPATGISPYRAARQSYAGDAEVIDAMRTGMNDFRKLDHEEIVSMMKDMSDAEKEAFRTGVVRNIYSQIMDPSTNINAAQRLVGSPETVAKLQPLFESPAKFKLFVSALERESQLVKEANRVLGGAATGRRIQQRESFEGKSPVGDVVADTITGSFGGSLINLAARVARSATMTDDIADKVSQLLMSSDPNEVAAAVKLLEDYGQKAVEQSAGQLVKEAGAIGAATNIAQPEATRPAKTTLEEDLATRSAPAQPGGADIEADLAARRRLPGTTIGR